MIRIKAYFNYRRRTHSLLHFNLLYSCFKFIISSHLPFVASFVAEITETKYEIQIVSINKLLTKILTSF
jgi:hypothetical protein